LFFLITPHFSNTFDFFRKAYLDENADVGVPIDHHDYFIQLGETFAKRVTVFMKYEEYYKKKYSMILKWVLKKGVRAYTGYT
jgi:hypothetical protein